MARKKIIFVIGTGRSGTHMIGHLLDSHPDIHVTIEDPRHFHMANDIAVKGQVGLLPDLIKIYSEHLDNHTIYADKSHQVIWIATALEVAFKGHAYFIGIERGVHAVVASMLKHFSIMNWHRSWKNYPVPNPYLGITEANVGSYDRLSDEEKCALRWRAHKEKMAELRTKLTRLLVLDYDTVIADPGGTVGKVAEFLGVSDYFDAGIIQRPKEDKVKSLTSAQISIIDRIVSS